MEFFKLVQSLPKKEKQALRHKITAACLIEPPTWYTWMRLKKIPRLSQKIISLELKQDIETLFPNK